MCIQDYAMMKYSKSSQRNVSITNASKLQLLAPSPNRIAVIIGSPAAGVNLYSLAADDTTTTGIRHAAGDKPLVLSKNEIGKAIELEWVAINNTGAETITVIETMLPIPLETLLVEWGKLIKGY